MLNHRHPPEGGRSALVVAHPGHELRVHGWLERERPRVFVLTDGSGFQGSPRLGSSLAVLSRLRAEPGAIFGRLTERRLYEAILDFDVNLFAGLVLELVEAFTRDGITFVAGDAVEGYNPGHDLCRLLIDSAVEAVNRVRTTPIANYDFPLIGPPDDRAPGSIVLELDDAARARKHDAARAYSGIEAEVVAAIERFGIEAFRRECLRPRRPHPDIRPPTLPPSYEVLGAERVAAGHYRRLIRYEQHLAPLAEAVFAAATPSARVP